MNKRNNSRKGATLAELIIVLAVLVIAATMVVSFSSMMHGAQGISNERFEAMQDVTAAESIIEGFIESNCNQSASVAFKSGSLVFTRGQNSEKKEATLGFHNNIHYIISSGYNGESVKMEFEHIDSITFKFMSTNGYVDNESEIVATGDIIYYCTINYSVDKTNYTYTFCVNPYTGE